MQRDETMGTEAVLRDNPRVREREKLHQSMVCALHSLLESHAVPSPPYPSCFCQVRPVSYIRLLRPNKNMKGRHSLLKIKKKLKKKERKEKVQPYALPKPRTFYKNND